MASFLDDTKNFGLLLMIVAIISIVAGVLVFVDDSTALIPLIGGILSGLVMAFAGYALFSKNTFGLDFIFPEGVDSKFGAITAYIFALGVAEILSLTWVGVVVGIIVLIAGWIITNDKHTIIDKFIWIILVILFFLGIIGGIITCLAGGFFIIVGIATALMCLMGFLYLFDPSVKSKM